MKKEYNRGFLRVLFLFYVIIDSKKLMLYNKYIKKKKDGGTKC